MKTLPDKSIDLVLTDPPYGTTACKWDSVIPFEPMWAELKRIRKGAVCLFGSEPFASALRMSNIKEFKYDWIWNKRAPKGHLNAKKRPLSQHEIISVFYSQQPTYNPIIHKNKLRREFKGESVKDETQVYGKQRIHNKNICPEKSYPRSIIEQTAIVGNSAEKLAHPTQKPVALLEYLIKTYTFENNTVLDFTMGSGSTGMACLNAKRKFIGIEKDDKYFKIASDRLLFTPSVIVTMDDLERYSHGPLLDSKGKADE
jgi:site-specific DNA-methyltransferase (adenine-specific)